MESLIDKLLELHRQQLHLNRHNEKVRSAGMAVAARQRQVTAAQNALNQLDEHRKNTQRLADARELDVKALQAKIQKLREQLNAIETNREYKALQNEIKFAEIELRRAEDDELGAMDQLEQDDGKMHAARERLTRTEAGLAEVQVATAAQAESLEADVRKAERDRADIAAQLPRDVLAVFDRLVSKHEDGAMCPLVKDDNPGSGAFSCGACHMRLTDNVYVRLVGNRNEIITCPNCSHILYVEQ